MFNAQTFSLDNGMNVVVVPVRRAPVVSHYVWYNVGTADSPAGKSGLPHFLEHLMFKGTKTIPPGEFSKVVARHGGDDNAFTSNDFTAYFQTIARDRLELVMQLEADRMANLTLADEHVYPERDVILEERKQRVDNEPQALLAEELNAAQYLHHPYRLPVIGWLHEIASYTREDAFSFYEKWYTPNNATLIVTGDIDAEELRPLAEKYYGVIEKRAVPARQRLVEPPQHAARRVVLRDEKVQQPVMMRSFLVPGAMTAEPRTSHPIELMSEVLGGGTTSILYRSLVVEQGLATAAGAHYNPASLDPTTFRVYASPRPGVEMERVEEALDKELARIVANPPAAKDVERTRNKMIAEADYSRDSIGGIARIFGMTLTTGGTIEDVEHWPERMGEVTLEQVAAVAPEIFVEARSVTGCLLPAAGRA